MKSKIKFSPQNSLILIMDQETGVIPLSMNGNLLAEDQSCIAIGTLMDVDGETEVILTNEEQSLSEQYFLVYDGMLAMPNRKISVCNVFNEVILDMDVEEECYIQIYVNHEIEPNSINIVVKNKKHET